MTMIPVDFATSELNDLTGHSGCLVVFADAEPDGDARRVDQSCQGAIARAMASETWTDVKPGEALELAFPAGLSAEMLLLVRLPRDAAEDLARKAGARIARSLGSQGAVIAARSVAHLPQLLEGLALRAYRWTLNTSEKKPLGAVTVAVTDPEAARAGCADSLTRAEAVHFTRDLVNEPANILTTSEFAARIDAMRDLGLEVEILEETDLEALGMRALLAVGQGSESPSKVAVMRWAGAEGAPLALIGKGVVFDTGGISIKPAAGMEEMVGDMGGAGVVAGTMRALAARKAKAHVVGIVGLVENMPDGRAQRPGDVVTSMKGDTIEVINTDAEGRLVLADIMWYAQTRFEPNAMIDLATLTGAMLIALGHDKAGVFSNDDALCNDLLAACANEDEGAWRMPLAPSYDALIKTRVADMKNTGGRAAGAITAAQFLQRFVKPGVAWAHIDIAGVSQPVGETEMSPKGPSGWGVRALDRLVRDRFEA
ncbi:leucyl aminopeptidase [Pararhodobacter oceanensis]|uniref:Probable cytosol aminopeptidase n=1 Tax=Pararhodobacter oceanensis TaxID=2172121 RepID=A0A2T8HY05_9RHOB|nr:leucyl aminopeptidase [Pararhodobacter oceanensis]PVH30307.1 leucyl aminopeptidase [Pararhodobacter oceanensis]